MYRHADPPPVIVDHNSSTTGHGGKRLDIAWNDDGKAPTHRDWGRVNIYLATGSRDVQFKLQTLDRNVSYNQGRASCQIDPSVGPNGGYYFIRFEGTNTTTNAIPAMAFSARFSLDQMKGTFNQTIMSTIQGASGTGQLTAAAASATSPSSSPSFYSFTSTQSLPNAAATSPASSAGSASSSLSTSVKSTSDAAPVNRLTGYASALVGLAAVGVAFL